MKSVKAARSFLVFLYNVTKRYVDCFRLYFLSICTLLFRLEYSMCLILSWPHYISFLALLHHLSCQSINLICPNHCKFCFPYLCVTSKTSHFGNCIPERSFYERYKRRHCAVLMLKAGAHHSASKQLLQSILCS